MDLFDRWTWLCILCIVVFTVCVDIFYSLSKCTGARRRLFERDILDLEEERKKGGAMVDARVSPPVPSNALTLTQGPRVNPMPLDPVPP